MTSDDVILRALRILRVAAHDEPATAEQMQVGRDVLPGLWDEVIEHVPTPFGLDAIPPRVVAPLARLLAVEIADDLAAAAPEPRTTAMIRLQAQIAPDDRPEREAQFF